jgi:periplasmic copper chaperone A
VDRDDRTRGRDLPFSRHRMRRLVVIVAAVPALVIGLVGSAAAHVSIKPSTTAAGAFAVLDVSVVHGCGGSSTTAITVQIPDGISSVTPTRHPLWEATVETALLASPVTDSHGNQVTERVASVTYVTDEPLPDGIRDVFQLSIQIPEAEGETLVFPTIQTCEDGESAWIEVPEDGESGDGLELPAPSFVITASEGDGHEAAAAATPTARGETTAQSAGDSSAVSLGAIGVGVLGVALAGAVLVRLRRRP